MQVFAGHDVGGGHRPVFGNFHVLLLEDHVALGVGDLSGAAFPFDLVVGRNPRLGKKAAEGQACGLLMRGGRSREGSSLGGGRGYFFTYLRHRSLSRGFCDPHLFIARSDYCQFPVLGSQSSVSLKILKAEGRENRSSLLLFLSPVLGLRFVNPVRRNRAFHYPIQKLFQPTTPATARGP